MTATRIAAAVLAAAVGITLWVSAGASGFVYTLVYALAIAPGLPLGFALFGRGHAAGWIGGALLGYGITQLALWAVIAGNATSPVAFVVAWAAAFALAWAAARTTSQPIVNFE